MTQEEDERRIERLKRRLGIQRKLDVLRAGIDLLEKEADRRERIRRWKHAVALVIPSSRGMDFEFQRHSRLKRQVSDSGLVRHAGRLARNDGNVRQDTLLFRQRDDDEHRAGLSPKNQRALEIHT